MKVQDALKFRSRFEELLTQISTQFINLANDQINSEFNSALRLVGQLGNVDRSYMFRFDAKNQTMINTHEWCAEGIKPEINSIQNFHVSAMPWFFNKIVNQPVIINRVAALPKAAHLEKKIFKSQDIQSLAIFPMRANQKLIGFVGFDSVRAERVWDEDITAMKQQFANILSTALERSRLMVELEDRAIRDELTGTLNRRGFIEFATIEQNRSLRFKRPVGLILFDMDHLKQVNDTFGHTAGDRIIQEIVKCCLKNIRNIDLLGRWGGDEFVVLLPESDLVSTNLVAERIRKIIEDHAFSIEGKHIHVTISVGLAGTDNADITLDELFQRANSALYSAKQAGRNCIFCYTKK